MSGYNNDYNKDLYTAQSSDFCKSCYSSGKSRQGCLVALGAAFAVAAVYIVAAAKTDSKTAVFITAAAVAAFIAVKVIRKNKKK